MDKNHKQQGMLLKEFWNKAIEYYCTFKSLDSKDAFDTVFLAVEENSLSKIKEKFINNGGLSVDVISIIENNIENVSGVKESYYSAVREAHNDLGNPAQYSFLRFSIFVLVAFKQDNKPLRIYWDDLKTLLNQNRIKIIPENIRTQYLKNIFKNLTQYCYTQHNKTFFQLNIFGDNHILVNVGKIKAHSIFQGSSLERFKKAIYNLGYSDSHSIEDLTYDDIKEILIDSGLKRILNLFQRDDDTKEIVFVCLKIWLKNWKPEQQEKVKFLNGKISNAKPKLQIQRIWLVDNEIEIKFGFISRSILGEDNVLYLNKNKNVFVDVAWGIKLDEFRTLYIIENYHDGISLDTNELGFQLKTRDVEIDKSEYALEKIPNRMYFIEQIEHRVKIHANPVLLASRLEVTNSEMVEFFTKYPIKNFKGLEFNLYRIKDSFNYNRLSFIKTNYLNIYPVGISDGRPGRKSYLSSFPIKIKYDNLSKGEIHIYSNNLIQKKIIPSKALECEEDIGLLKSGNYLIKYFNDNQQYEHFLNGQDYIDFEIVESGLGDRRRELIINSLPDFEYHEFRWQKTTKNIEDSFLILHDFASNLEFKDFHTFFYFTKNNFDEWVIKLNKDYFFIQRLKEKPINLTENYYQFKEDFEYLSTSFIKYNYKISFCKSPETVDLIFDLKEFYQRNEECRINVNTIKINCYYFRLEELDDALKIKYPDINIGDVIYIISNKSESKSENLLKLLNQEVFPFKK
jgi:hypothetical protein